MGNLNPIISIFSDSGRPIVPLKIFSSKNMLKIGLEVRPQTNAAPSPQSYIKAFSFFSVCIPFFLDRSAESEVVCLSHAAVVVQVGGRPTSEDNVP